MQTEAAGIDENVLVEEERIEPLTQRVSFNNGSNNEVGDDGQICMKKVM